jgi:hypothetical protein
VQGDEETRTALSMGACPNSSIFFLLDYLACVFLLVCWFVCLFVGLSVCLLTLWLLQILCNATRTKPISRGEQPSGGAAPVVDNQVERKRCSSTPVVNNQRRQLHNARSCLLPW